MNKNSAKFKLGTLFKAFCFYVSIPFSWKDCALEALKSYMIASLVFILALKESLYCIG